MTRLRPSAVFKVKKVSEYHWEVRDRSHKSAVMEFRLQYVISDRRFDCEVHSRYSKKERWQPWAPATPEQMERALAIIGEAEVARCMADSLLKRRTPW